MPVSGELSIGQWNIEGLTPSKVQLQLAMRKLGIGILCMQETHLKNSDYYVSEEGYLIILSGSTGGGREYAGIGFIVAPHFKQHIIGFNPTSSRISSVKLRVPKGCCYIFCIYAPHNGYPLDVRMQFYDDLEKSIRNTSANGPRFIFGDFNARIGKRRPNEEGILGEHCFGREAVHRVEVPNRDLLLEFCISNSYIIGNTFLPGDAAQKVTYFEPCASPFQDITPCKFSMLDLLLLPARCAKRLITGWSDRYACIASHHFPFTSVLDVQLEARAKTE